MLVPRTLRPSACLQKLDALPLCDGLIYERCGVRVGVRCDAQGIVHRLAHALGSDGVCAERGEDVVDEVYTWLVPTSVRREHLLFRDGQLVAASLDTQQLLHRLAGDLHREVAERAQAPWLFVHAGVVAWGDRALLLPGASHAGKTTLVEALVEQGALYLSDEYAVLDERGHVHPFPKPLSLRVDGGRSPRSVPRARQARGPLQVGAVVVTTYQPGAALSLDALSAGAGALRLLEHVVRARAVPGRSLRTLARTMRSARAYAGARGEAQAAAQSLLGILRAHGAPRVQSEPSDV